EGGMRRYAGKDQVFAFADSAVTSESQKQDIMLYAFAALDTATASKSTTRPPAVAAKAPARKNDEMADRLLKISANLANGQLDLLSHLVLSIYPDPVGEFDSTQLILTDESFTPLRNYPAALDSTPHKLTITYAWQENAKNNLLLDTAFAA